MLYLLNQLKAVTGSRLKQMSGLLFLFLKVFPEKAIKLILNAENPKSVKNVSEIHAFSLLNKICSSLVLQIILNQSDGTELEFSAPIQKKNVSFRKLPQE